MKYETKLHDTKVNYSRQLCKCGHSVTMIPKRESIICSHCGRTIKNKTRGHFIYKLGALLWKI